MKTLKFAPHLVEKILSGEKNSTWRLFDDKNLQEGDELIFINKETGEQFGTAKITSLKTKTLGTLTDDDRAGHEKYASDNEMYASYKKYYGDKVDENSEVKILTFDFTKDSPTAHEDEYLDLVNDNDEVIGKKLRSEVYAENLSNFRVVNTFLINTEGKIWFPRRTANKRMFPLCLDMSMGGHVESGETYDQAFKRELMEELKIDADTTPWRLLGHLSPQINTVSANMNVYEIQMNETPNYNQDDFTESFWLTPAELFARIAAGEKTKEDLPKLVRHFYPPADAFANAAMDRGTN
ncbi:MAG: NUDIX domain-containing protein [Candidatus Pacebacteria bacterium]|nr:NUDIX domain-containing protein [Candidatus Paceibacterota bacterium]